MRAMLRYDYGSPRSSRSLKNVDMPLAKDVEVLARVRAAGICRRHPRTTLMARSSLDLGRDHHRSGRLDNAIDLVATTPEGGSPSSRYRCFGTSHWPAAASVAA
jgi:hypothetical protein